MAPDNRISGAITYVVPAEATLDRVVYQPASDRLIELADLGGGGGPALGDPVTYTARGRLERTVSTQLVDPFTATRPGVSAAGGVALRRAPVGLREHRARCRTTPTRMTSPSGTRTGSSTTQMTVYQPEGARSRRSKARR